MPSKKDEAIVETPVEETSDCACGTHMHPRRKMIMHACIAAVALFMLCSAFAAGALIGKFAGNHDGGREGRGTCAYQQRGGNSNYGPGMMGRGGRGMMRGGQGYYNYQQGTTEDSTAPDTQAAPATPATPAPATPQGGATQ
jgi:hypothetical protein